MGEVIPHLNDMIALARDPQTSFVRLLELRKVLYADIYRALLENPNICPENQDGSLNTEILISVSSVFPEEVANHALFVLHAIIEPREDMNFVVANVLEKTTDPNLIEQLFRSYQISSRVRQVVASNPYTPVSLLRCLADPSLEFDWFVREQLAQNRNLPDDLLQKLGDMSIEPSFRVRREVARNPSTPEAVVQAILDRVDEDPDVLIAAKKELMRRRLR